MRFCHRFFLLWVLVLPFALQAQKDSLSEDVKAQRWLRQGKTYLELKQFDVADYFFQKVINRPFSQSTTAAYYLSAISSFRLEQSETAQQRFETFLERFPRSRYAPESRYHLAMLDLRSSDMYRHRTGLEMMRQIHQRSRNSSLVQDAEQVARAFLYVEAEDELWMDRWPEEARPPLREWLLEGRIYRQLQRGDSTQARWTYERYLDAYGQAYAPAMALLNGRPPGSPPEDSIIRLAMVLPVHAHLVHDSLTEIPRESRIALEFYEGFMIGIQHAQEGMNRKAFVQVLDSRRDPILTQRALRDLRKQPPHLIVGDIYNAQSDIVGAWAERHEIPQIVPLSPSADLVDRRQQVFLAHPTPADHGRAMGKYAWEDRKLTRMVVFTDQRKGTEVLANAFSQTFDTLGGEILRITVDSVYNDSTQESMRNLVNSLKRQRFDGVYIPILGNQETAGLILSQMAVLGLRKEVLGSPHWWERYQNIDRTLKEQYGVTFSAPFITERQTPSFQLFYDAYLKTYALPPSVYAVQGYDLARYTCQVLDNYLQGSRLTLADFLRRYPYYQGLHQGFAFSGQQSNQFVNVVAYQDGTVKPVNRPEEQPIDDFFDIETPVLAEEAPELNPFPRTEPLDSEPSLEPRALPESEPAAQVEEEKPRRRSRLKLLGKRNRKEE